MAIEGVDDAYLLPCGQDAAILWEHVATGELNEHELECEHCQAASAGFIALREVTGELTEADVVPPRDLTERIMRAVRTSAGATRSSLSRSPSWGRSGSPLRPGRSWCALPPIRPPAWPPGPARWSRSPTGRTAGA